MKPVQTLRFLWWLALPFAATFGLFPFVVHASEPPTAVARGGRVGWGRLITESPSWSVHSQNDPTLAAFIRKLTSLNIDPTCYPVDPRDLSKLCAYPLVFTINLANVHDTQRLANLREYLKRGGFIYIDRCVNLSFSLEQEIFYRRHIDLFASFLPGAEVRELQSEHEINRYYFTSNLLAEHRANPRRELGHDGIYMEMIANIYVYVMTR